MVGYLVHSWLEFSSSWFDFWFGKYFEPQLFKQFRYIYQPQAIDNQSTWWKFVDLEDVVPYSRYLNGEIVEA
jgi:hypothetical protein